MDDSERDEILYRLDERTARIDGRIERVHVRVSEQDELLRQTNKAVDASLGDLDRRVSRNTTILSAMTLGISTFVGAIITKFGALLNFK